MFAKRNGRFPEQTNNQLFTLRCLLIIFATVTKQK